jgi:hypothetical protein
VIFAHRNKSVYQVPCRMNKSSPGRTATGARAMAIPACGGARPSSRGDRAGRWPDAASGVSRYGMGGSCHCRREGAAEPLSQRASLRSGGNRPGSPGGRWQRWGIGPPRGKRRSPRACIPACYASCSAALLSPCDRYHSPAAAEAPGKAVARVAALRAKAGGERRGPD